MYKKALCGIATHLGEHWRDEFDKLANIEIFYLMCEYNKALLAIFLGGEKAYTPTKYVDDNHRALAMFWCDVKAM